MLRMHHGENFNVELHSVAKFPLEFQIEHITKNKRIPANMLALGKNVWMVITTELT